MTHVDDVLANNLALMPKVDLHRHLEGALRVESLLQMAQRGEVALPQEIDRLVESIQITDDDPRTPRNFLNKFLIIRKFLSSPETIQRLTREAVLDAADDNVRYLEMHFTPLSFAQSSGLPLENIFDWICSSAAAAAQESGIRVSLIASINRRESVKDAEAVAGFACDYMGRGVVGLGLAGDEATFPAAPFRPVFAGAKQSGLGITIHAGEWAGAGSVREALEELGADRIGHGVRVLEDPEVVALARQRRVIFEVCPTSNLHTGVVASMGEHSLSRMIAAGLQVTINTDDPSVSGIRLTDEYLRVVRELDVSVETLKAMILTAIQAAYLPRGEKETLEAEFLTHLLQEP